MPVFNMKENIDLSGNFMLLVHLMLFAVNKILYTDDVFLI